MGSAAWVGKIMGISSAGTGDSLIMNVTYYLATDVDFANPLWSKTFPSIPGSASIKDMTAQIQAAGACERAAQDTAAAAKNLIGTTINIP